MGFKKFKQYLEERTKHSHGIISDDKGFAGRDYDGDLSLKPKPAKRLKPKDYYAPGADKNPGLMTADDSNRGQALGDMSSPGMTPGNSACYGVKPSGKLKFGSKKKKKLPTSKAMKTENFLARNRNMTDSQFTKHMLENVEQIPVPKVKDLYGREYTPEPAQTMKYVAHLMLTNENMMRRMVREIKRNNGFHLLISEVLQHQETYDCMNEAARGNFGKTAETKINMFFEGVSPPRNTGNSPGPASQESPSMQGKGNSPFSPGTKSPTPGPSPYSGGMSNGGGEFLKTSGGGGLGGGMGGGMGMGEEGMMDDMPKLGDADGDISDEDMDKDDELSLDDDTDKDDELSLDDEDEDENEDDDELSLDDEDEDELSLDDEDEDEDEESLEDDEVNYDEPFDDNDGENNDDNNELSLGDDNDSLDDDNEELSLDDEENDDEEDEDDDFGMIKNPKDDNMMGNFGKNSNMEDF